MMNLNYYRDKAMKCSDACLENELKNLYSGNYSRSVAEEAEKMKKIVERILKDRGYRVLVYSI